MVEIMVALVIIGLAVTPMLGLLNTSSVQTQSSMSNFIAMQYADEITKQLFTLAPVFPQMLTAAASLGDANAPPTVADILSELASSEEFCKDDGFYRMVPFTYKGSGLGPYLVLPPTPKNFKKRYMIIESLDSSNTNHFTGYKLVKVTIGLEWQDSPAAPYQKSAFAIVLKSNI